MKCKNIECDNDTPKHRTYCSLKCRNVYVNKYLRDYNKNSNGLRKKFIERHSILKMEYLNNNPPNCKLCGKLLPYEKRNNKFCSKKCSVKYINSNREIYGFNLSADGLKGIINSNKKKLQKAINKYLENPKYCKRCNEILKYDKRNHTYCSKKCAYPNLNINGLQNYRIKCRFKFNLSDYPDEFKFDLIKERGWYSAANRGNNLYGVSRDHIYSVKDGFDNNIDPAIIAHPANCKLILHSENVSKYTKSNITLKELINKIDKWNKKYGVIV